MASATEEKAYLLRKNVHLLLEEVLGELIKEKPEDVVGFFITTLQGIQQRESRPKINPLTPARPTQLLSPSAPSDGISLDGSEGLDRLREAFKKRAVDDVLTKEAFIACVQELVPPDGAQQDAVLQLHTIFDAFDRDRNNSVDMNEFASGMRIMLRGSEEEKMEFAFSGLDYDHDGHVTKEEFLKYFKHYFTAKAAIDGRKLEPHRWQSIQDHLRRVFKGTDTDSSGFIDIAEFRTAVLSDPDHPFSIIWDSFAAKTPHGPKRSPRFAATEISH
eukprot:TRINITY_DN70349_c0_g1_i1.p1 TRINITY_DN70349_c0_g1~~TRINITY_DN70349_c0_g1_i1.p1  ORF type:complete len:287 (+),score=58.50 TRINITY_DN70349_c0_g1_i1:40-861(+)